MTEGSAEPVLLTTKHGAVEVLQLNRPQYRNAMNTELLLALGNALIAAEEDAGVRAIVLTGAGDRAFCAGMDLRAFAAGAIGMDATADIPARAAAARLQRGEYAKPVVGAANGSAVAGGFELLLGCDVIVASAAATFGLPEAKRGLFAARGGMALGRRIPLAVALEVALTGDPITAERAAALGLVNCVASPDAVLDTAIDLATRIAANAPLAIAASRELMRLSVTDPVAAAARQQEWESRVFTSGDAREGATAFVEKRDPIWTGQ